MHELSIAMALVEDVERAIFRDAALSESERAPDAPKRPRTFYPGAVATIRIRIGTLSGVDPEALKQAFPVAAEGTCCDRAELTITEVETRAVCRACGAEFSPEFPFCVCTACGATDITVTAGRELLLESIELNDND